MKKVKTIVATGVLVVGLISLAACGTSATTSHTAKPSASQSSQVVKKSDFSQVKNQTIRNALIAYPTLKAFNQAIDHPSLNITASTILIKLKNDGKRGGWIIVKKGTAPTAEVSTDDNGKAVKANDPRGATVEQIRAAFKNYK